MKVTTVAFIRNIVHDINFLTADDHYVMCFSFYSFMLIKKMALTEKGLIG
jgi:hypothetical protein